jgi:hypothetical protein
MTSIGNHAEGNTGFPCLFYDCQSSEGQPLPYVGLRVSRAVLRRHASAIGGRSKLGFATMRPARGHFRVRVVTAHFRPRPPALWGAFLASTPERCFPSLDSFRTFWPQQALQWTGRDLLSFEFIDEGTVRFPTADGGLVDNLSVLTPALKALYPLGPQDLLLVAIDWPNGGIADGPEGVAVVGVGAPPKLDPVVIQAARLLTARHELGHLFGASDLYDSTGACRIEASVEVPGPNLYCGYGDDVVARLTAREVGWISFDGGTAQAPCEGLPGSAFGCDP